MSPAASWASSSRSRNQFAAAGPIVPLTNSAGGRAGAVEIGLAITEDVRLGEIYWSFQ